MKAVGDSSNVSRKTRRASVHNSEHPLYEYCQLLFHNESGHYFLFPKQLCMYVYRITNTYSNFDGIYYLQTPLINTQDIQLYNNNKHVLYVCLFYLWQFVYVCVCVKRGKRHGKCYFVL